MNSAVIVAAGRGCRMGGSMRKQYLPLDGLPILARTLTVFTESGLFEEIILVVAAAEQAYCRGAVLGLLKTPERVRLVAGGRERQESVFNGLAAIRGNENDLVLVHDGVRPFVSAETLAACLAGAGRDGACIVAVKASDTLKQVDADGRICRTFPRHSVWLAQTPQGFRLGLLRKAHHRAREEGFVGTDDAQLVERMGGVVTILEGSRLNIKITTPDDLRIGEAILRTGSGMRTP